MRGFRTMVHPLAGVNDTSRSMHTESLTEHMRRCTLGVLYDFKPPRHRDIPEMTSRWMAYRRMPLEHQLELPDLDAAPLGDSGFIGFGDCLSVANMRRAYANGIYPMTHFGPQRWHAPPLRAVLEIDKFRMRRELRRKLRKDLFNVTFDAEPLAVIEACAEPRDHQWPLTWITPKVTAAFLDMFDAGYTHSVEVWDDDGNLCGGLFGTQVGSVFVFESLFHKASNSSKYGFAVLTAHLQSWGFRYLDNKLQTPHTQSLGFREIPHALYLDKLNAPVVITAPTGRWMVDEQLDLGAWRPARGAPPRKPS